MSDNSSKIDDLPQGWIRTSVRDIFEIVGGGTPSTKISSYWEGPIPWITSADIHGFHDIKPRKKISQEAIENSATHCIPKGNIIVVTRVGLGKIGLTHIDLCISQDCQALLGYWHHLSANYCLYYLADAVQIFKYKNRGTTISGVTVNQLKELEIPLPPLPEQYRIVTKIEELNTQLDAGVTALEKVQIQLRRYRKAVLAASLDGRLTKDWREAHPIEDAKILLDEIVREREAMWRHSNKMRGKGLGKYPVPFDIETPIIALPEGWTIATLSHIVFFDVGFAFKSEEFSNTGIRLLRGDNIKPGRIDWENKRCISTDRYEEYSQLLLEEGDIVLGMDRPIISSGLKLARVRKTDMPCLLVQRVMRFRFVKTDIRDFAYYCLAHPRFADSIQRGGLTGSDLPHITGKMVPKFVIPFPPLAEQNEIVKQIEYLFSIADEVERTIKTSLKQAESLRRSILIRAFEGRLVPQDPNDEPAAVLLERIKAEKAKQEPARKRAMKVKSTAQRRLIPNGE